MPFVEKAYAKLHGTYDALIGGYVDYGLRDLTGGASEHVVLAPGFHGYNPSDVGADGSRSRAEQDDFVWRKLREYDDTGCLMGCSIQPLPKSGNAGGVEMALPQGATADRPGVGCGGSDGSGARVGGIAGAGGARRACATTTPHALPPVRMLVGVTGATPAPSTGPPDPQA